MADRSRAGQGRPPQAASVVYHNVVAAAIVVVLVVAVVNLHPPSQAVARAPSPLQVAGDALSSPLLSPPPPLSPSPSHARRQCPALSALLAVGAVPPLPSKCQLNSGASLLASIPDPAQLVLVTKEKPRSPFDSIGAAFEAPRT